MLQSFHIGQMQIIASRHELHEFGLVCPSFSQIVPTYSFLLSFEVERDASKLNVVKLCQVLILLYSSSSPTSNKPLQVLTKHGLKTLGHLRSAIVKGQIWSVYPNCDACSRTTTIENVLAAEACGFYLCGKVEPCLQTLAGLGVHIEDRPNTTWASCGQCLVHVSATSTNQDVRAYLKPKISKDTLQIHTIQVPQNQSLHVETVRFLVCMHQDYLEIHLYKPCIMCTVSVNNYVLSLRAALTRPRS